MATKLGNEGFVAKAPDDVFKARKGFVA
ncbi:hypothetical protein HX122_02590 [Acinetobacter towneri]|nr:hypothetical protein [Acinetobacter towneri]